MEKLFYDIEVFKYDSLIVFEREDHSLYGMFWNDDPQRASKLSGIVNQYQLVGYNNHSYDDNILSYMIANKSAADIKRLNDRIIRGEDVRALVPAAIKSRICSLDTMQQIDVSRPSLKQIEGNLGMSIEESSVPFDLERPLTNAEKRETELYCQHDVDATIEVYKLREKSYYDVKDSLIQMLPEDIRRLANNWNTTTIATRYLIGDKKNLPKWSDIRVPERYWRSVDNIPKEAWDMWDSLTTQNIMDKGKFVSAEIFGCEVTFGVGGLHGAPLEPVNVEDALDADVKSMYPSIVVHPEIRVLGTATERYDALRRKRISVKKTDPVLALALKLILNSVYGNLKNKYSPLYNPFASVTVCVYGQIAAIALCNLLDRAGYRIININTDGVVFLDNPNATRSFDDIKAEWEKEFKLDLDLDRFDRWIQRDVNNYVAITPEGEIKAKGGDVNKFAKGKPFSNDDARIVQIAFVEYLAHGTPIEETLNAHIREPKLWQYVLETGTKFRETRDSEGNILNKVNRVFAVKEGTPGATTLKKYRADGTSTKYSDAPDRMIVWNRAISEFTDFANVIDKSHYKAIAEKKLENWRKVRKPAKPKKKPNSGTLNPPAVTGVDARRIGKKVSTSSGEIPDDMKYVLSKFSGIRRSKAYWMVRCPVHDDHDASLSVGRGKDGTITLKCFAGCKRADIMTAAGLTDEDLTRMRKDPDAWKKPLIEDLKKQHRVDDVRLTDVYRYTDAHGRYLYSKIRYYAGESPEKKLRYIRVSADGSSYYTGKGHYHPDPALYNLPELNRTISRGYPVYYVEGEKDVNTLKDLGWTATTAGGANDWEPSFAHYFTGAYVTILADNDAPGTESAMEVRKSIARYAFATRVVVPSSREKGDVTDYLKGMKDLPAEGDEASLKAKIDDVPWEYVDFVNVNEQKNGVKLSITEGKLQRTVEDGEKYFLIKMPGDNKVGFYWYNGKCYKQENATDIAGIVQRYLPCTIRTSAKVRAVKDLVLQSMHNRIGYEDLDTESTVIAVQNGILNLQSRTEDGHYTLSAHSPKYRLTTCLHTEYDPDAECPVFTGYMKDLCKDMDGAVDWEKYNVIQEYVGLIISNLEVLTLTKKGLVLYSPEGNTGKSQLIKVVTALIGDDKQCNINLSEMNRDHNKFSMKAIVGKRMIQIPDMSAITILNSTVFKQLLGGDRVTIEGKGQDVFDYQFKGGLIMACNGLPRFVDDKGDHIAERMVIVPCEHHILEEDRDPYILDRMKNELPGILNWALEGLQRYLDNETLTIPEATQEAQKEYKSKSDTVYRFLSSHYVVTKNSDDRVLMTALNDEYETWYTENFSDEEKKWVVKKSNVKARLAGYGVICKKARTKNHGTKQCYFGIRPMTDAEKQENADPEFG